MKVGTGGQLVNNLGRYLYKHIDSAYKGVNSANTYDVYMIVYYQLPGEKQIPGKDDINDVHEMIINLNLTTYQNKIRLNMNEVTEDEWTFGQMIISPEKLEDMDKVRKMILDRVHKRLEKQFSEYDFIF